MFFDTEVILLNVLKNDIKNEGVTYGDIRNYCDNLKQYLFENNKTNCVCFGISKNSLEDIVEKYPRIFRSYSGRYYKGVGYNPNLFDNRMIKI